MRSDEEFAANKLDEYLVGEGHERKHGAGDNPPDYVFLVDNERWAVEVTGLYQYVNLNGEQSAVWVNRGLHKVFDDIEQATRGSRSYSITLRGPIAARDVNRIKKSAAEHINQNLVASATFGDKEECQIHPENGAGARLFPILMIDGRTNLPKGPEIVANIQAIIDYAIDRILSAKIPRLIALAGYNKRVLVVVLEYFFADEENVSKSMARHKKALDQIDTLYLVQGDFVVSRGP